MSMTRGNDQGATAVEFALVVLIILVLSLGAVDFGLWMFQKSEAAQAAREASRVAMISPPTAFGTQASGSIYDAATAQIESSLPQFDVSVSCADAAGSAITDPSLCVSGDLVTVTVNWHRDPLTLVGLTDTVSGTSTRTVVGLP
jgi:Flp pilus assembly protein TadG